MRGSGEISRGGWSCPRAGSQWMWIRVRRVVERPRVGCRANIQFTLTCAVATLVPVSLIGRPVRHAGSAGRRTGRESSAAYAGRTGESVAISARVWVGRDVVVPVLCPNAAIDRYEAGAVTISKRVELIEPEIKRLEFLVWPSLRTGDRVNFVREVAFEKV